MKYTAILGLNPSKGARSPKLWNKVYKELGIECEMRAIDCENPQLEDDTVKACYQATQERTKPGKYGKIRQELLSVDEGGTSYWSLELHCWITGHVDKDGTFIPPDWTK